MCWVDLPDTCSDILIPYTVLQSIERKHHQFSNDSQPTASPILCCATAKCSALVHNIEHKFYLAVCQLKERRIFLTLSFILSDMLTA